MRFNDRNRPVYRPPYLAVVLSVILWILIMEAFHWWLT